MARIGGYAYTILSPTKKYELEYNEYVISKLHKNEHDFTTMS